MPKPTLREQINKNKINRLIDANHALLNFIRQKYPDDFKEGGSGFTCPHHREIDGLLKEIHDLD